MRRLRTLLLVSCVILAWQPPATAALPSGGNAAIALPEAAGRWTVEQDLQVAQGRGKSLNEAVEQVKRQYPNSRVVSAETRRSGNREVHHIKILTQDGKVRTVKVQGRSLNSRG